ncbi:uncharacterized protein PV09_07514 [Verruconis gallopava]|uniref:diacylglycerol cholinephosphotransferase n=1 Tax=Verruconis gallopava TaxID=253628 RepID=A0A0D2A3L2_9PEZI|nr:uncharacterized protein PV09_07514 [Verruconis gallopava]KIW00995.1 hypothetical protein PV09_07514 [Verruconis gallopava]
MVYIRQDKLPKLKEYKYSAVDKSLVSKYILKPFYTHVVIKCFPMSMAPNLITLSGFGFVVINLLTLLYYSPGLDQDCPPWVYASWAVGLFLYQTFDAVDGAQARRTHQSGPLGELFDHGVDAVNTTLGVIIFAACMNMGQTWKTVLIQFSALLTFYIQTWEEYHTKTLTLGLVSGPVEGILTLCAVFAITAVKGGGSFWQQSLLASIGVPNTDLIWDPVYEMTWVDWYMLYGGVIIVVNTIWASQGVMRARRARGKRTRVALLGLLPFFATWTLISIYLALQPVILHHHLVPFMFFTGLINAYSVGQMIVAHLTQSPYPYGNVLMYPMLYGVIDSIGPVLLEKFGFGWPSALGYDTYQVAFVFCCLGLAVGVYGSFIFDVITTICDYLDIWCLTIKHPWTGDDNDANGSVKADGKKSQ